MMLRIGREVWCGVVGSSWGVCVVVYGGMVWSRVLLNRSMVVERQRGDAVRIIMYVDGGVSQGKASVRK